MLLTLLLLIVSFGIEAFPECIQAKTNITNCSILNRMVGDPTGYLGNNIFTMVRHGEEEWPDFMDVGIREHNKYRAMHGVPALKGDQWVRIRK